ITDITDNLTSRAGDWQCGGTAQKPTGVCGVWKPYVAGFEIDDPPMNSSDHHRPPGPHDPPAPHRPRVTGFNLGGGADPYPPLPDATCTCEGSTHCTCAAELYGAEVKWALSGLVDNLGKPLQSGHTYRIVVMVHDGDQNKDGGDVGEQC